MLSVCLNTFRVDFIPINQDDTNVRHVKLNNTYLAIFWLAQYFCV